LPLTYVMIDVVAASFGIAALLVPIAYGGELIWRDRKAKIDFSSPRLWRSPWPRRSGASPPHDGEQRPSRLPSSGTRRSMIGAAKD